MGLEEELLTPSELRYVMEDIKNFSPSFAENSVPMQQLFNDQVDMYEPNQPYDSDHSDKPAPKRKKSKRMCDSTLSIPASLETLPCLEPYPGDFNFQLQLPADNSTHKWTYSKILKKVFIDIDKVLALQFKWNYSDVKTESEMYVRAMPVFTAHDSLKMPVMRCPIHLMLNDASNQGFRFIEHVMRCEHSSTMYEKDPVSQRLSCRTPLSRPQPGSETTTLTYKFVCKTSCLGGMNRRPISVIFTLEDVNRHEYGRQQLAVKICSCPKRDKVKEEDNEIEKEESASRVISAASSNFGPSMVCVRNTSATSNSHGEPLRDIRIDGLNPFIYRAFLKNLYDAFVGSTIRCSLTDTDDIIHQLQIQLDTLDRHQSNRRVSY